MALSSWPALSSHSLVMVSPTFFMSALSRVLAATMAMPFFFSRSRYPVFLAVLVAQPRVSASAGHLQQRSLAGRVQRVQRGLVDDHRVLGQPGLGVHPEFQVLVGLAVVAGGAAGHVAFDHAGGHGLAQLGRLHGDRLRAHQLGDAAGAGAVSAPLTPFRSAALLTGFFAQMPCGGQAIACSSCMPCSASFLSSSGFCTLRSLPPRRSCRPGRAGRRRRGSAIHC